MLIFAMKADLYLPELHSLKEKRKIRHSLVEKIKARNISVIESGRQDEHQHLELLLSFASLGEQEAQKKKDFILALFDEVTMHITFVDDCISVEQ